MSKIEWTDTTWNPTVGCTRVSEGCRNCYAFESHDRRHKGYPWPNAPKQYAKPFSEVQLMPDRLDAPLRWRKPRRVFVNSMSDLFHPDVPDEFIYHVFLQMARAKKHQFQVLTKRPERMARLVPEIGKCTGTETTGDINVWPWPSWPLSNVWLGVSVETQEHQGRIVELLRTPAAVHFLSLEPLLGPIALDPEWLDPIEGGPRIDWVIVGGESGSKARPCGVKWVRSIVEQCREAPVPVFVKQLGANVWRDEDTQLWLTDRKGGDPAEWPEDLRVRQWPKLKGEK